MKFILIIEYNKAQLRIIRVLKPAIFVTGREKKVTQNLSV